MRDTLGLPQPPCFPGGWHMVQVGSTLFPWTQGFLSLPSLFDKALLKFCLIVLKHMYSFKNTSVKEPFKALGNRYSRGDKKLNLLKRLEKSFLVERNWMLSELLLLINTWLRIKAVNIKTDHLYKVKNRQNAKEFPPPSKIRHVKPIGRKATVKAGLSNQGSCRTRLDSQSFMNTLFCSKLINNLPYSLQRDYLSAKLCVHLKVFLGREAFMQIENKLISLARRCFTRAPGAEYMTLSE